MKTLALTLALVASPLAAFAVVLKDAATKDAPVSKPMKISVGKHVFTATLYDNATVKAFKARLPLSLNMHDVNRNEKAFDLSSDLPTADTNPSTIRAGDLMIWNSRTVVVFYKNFSTPYSYTKLGHVDNPTGLTDALGAENVTVTFELQ